MQSIYSQEDIHCLPSSPRLDPRSLEETNLWLESTNIDQRVGSNGQSVYYQLAHPAVLTEISEKLNNTAGSGWTGSRRWRPLSNQVVRLQGICLKRVSAAP